MPPGGVSSQQALSLYRSILRAARAMPTKNRRAHVTIKTREEFEANKTVADPEKIK
jgi:hypothetical protein